MIGDSISEKARQETETQRNKALAKARQASKDRVELERKARLEPPSWPKTVARVLVALIGVAVAALHFVPLNGYIAGARQVLSQRLGVPVDISELRYALLPWPELTLQGVALGEPPGSEDRQRRRRRGSLRAAREHEEAR